MKDRDPFSLKEKENSLKQFCFIFKIINKKKIMLLFSNVLIDRH